MKYEVKVQLKTNVLNVEAKEILSSIKSQGFDTVESLSTAKLFIVELQNDGNAESVIKAIASSILTNEVIENFTITKVNDQL